jgi:rhamnopyranosyl-N-acetylglucosaminyl-diphospho-decaprenol beta-1,3/1,4-galactofuranosyltransferase
MNVKQGGIAFRDRGTPQPCSHSKRNEESMPDSSICALILTHNRLALLKECIAALRRQTLQPDGIVVVNNDSTDGTQEWLQTQMDVRQVLLSTNTGSAGGFHAGIRDAYEHGFDWVWCMDDDTIPEPTALERLTVGAPFEAASTGFICSLGYRLDGSVCTYAKQLQKTGATIVSLHYATWLSILIRREAIRAVGLPRREFFMDYEDIDYTARIVAAGFNGYCKRDSIVLHKTLRGGSLPDPKDTLQRQRFCYWLRNAVWTYRSLKSYGGRRPWPFWQLLLYGYFTFMCLRAIALRRVPPSTAKWLLDGFRHNPAVECVEAGLQRPARRGAGCEAELQR